MTAKAVDYSKYTHDLTATSEQIAKLDSQRENLQDKKMQIERTLRQKPEIPMDETAYDLKNAYTPSLWGCIAVETMTILKAFAFVSVAN